MLKHRFNRKECFWLDLLDSSVEDRFLRNPSELYSIVKALSSDIKYVIIDEIQKAITRVCDNSLKEERSLTFNLFVCNMDGTENFKEDPYESIHFFAPLCTLNLYSFLL